MKTDSLHKTVKECARPVEPLLYLNYTVNEAIDHIRKSHAMDKNVLYFYVVDDRMKLLGTVSARDLLLSPPDKLLSDVIHVRIKSIHAYHTMQDALLLMQKFQLLALPVIDNGIFIGIINIHNYFDEAVELSNTKQRTEIFQTLGFFLEEEGEVEPTWKKYITRFPWLFCNMFSGIVCAVIANFYEGLLLKVIILAMFIPLVLALSESISMQSMTQGIYEISKNNHIWRHFSGYILHESKLFALISITSGIMIGLISLLWREGIYPAITIGASITIAIMVSALLGALIPFILYSCKLDPKIASGPIVLCIADVVTTLIYFGIGSYFFL